MIIIIDTLNFLMIQNSSINCTIYLQYLILQVMKRVGETTEKIY